MRTIPVDLILHELAARLAELPDPQHRDLHLAISGGCIRPQTLAEEWIHGAGVAQQSAWLIRRLDGEDMTAHRLREIAAETRAMEVAVARRLADCAISLLVTQDAEDAATAQTLLQAAQRVVGLPAAKPGAEAGPPASIMYGVEDDLSPATLRHYLAATRDALGLGSGPVYLGDIVTRAKSLAAANEAHRSSIETITNQRDTAWAERNVARHVLQDLRGALHEALGLSMDGATDKTIIERIGFLKSEVETWSSWATKLAGQEHAQASSKALREALSARLIDSKGQRLKVARDCLPDGEGIVVCLRDDKPTTYKASNTGEEYDSPEAAVRAAWEHHLRPTQSVPDRAFKVGDNVRYARINSDEGYWKSAPPLGWEGEITDIDESNLPIRVSGPRWSDSHISQGWWFTAANLDLITPTA